MYHLREMSRSNVNATFGGEAQCFVRNEIDVRWYAQHERWIIETHERVVAVIFFTRPRNGGPKLVGSVRRSLISWKLVSGA